ncbi:replication protein [Paraburkholderia sp. Cpub6]|uniref:replication protein n=1 Tax=Paraburkholderia sp. Cpub6 TaxID=2723094 RepID=UPI001619F6F1|nr:replication protein [Paraburkholderia sp. Cpub6]MBB5462902.1 phage replication O-like protein O [Paraburkholderia sp. Cpub6]
MALAEVIHMPEYRSPQLEEGYTRIANELLEAITLAPFSQNQYKVILTVWRMTYGFNKQSDQLALSQIMARTGMQKPQASLAVSQLIEMRVLLADEGRHARVLSLNKVYSKWAQDVRVVLPSWGSENQNHKVMESVTVGSESQNSTVLDSGTTKDKPKRKDQKTTPKENLSRSLRERFEIFWEAYPRKRSKKAAEKAFAKVNPDEQLFNDLMAGLERAKTSEQWRNPQFQPHAATWLSDGGWMDEIQTTYTDDEIAVIRAFNGALGERIGTVDEAVFVEARAGAIRAFMGKLAADPEAWKRYFPAVRDKVDLPPHAGFDYLISPKGFGDVKGRMSVKRNPDGTRATGDWDKSASGIKTKAQEMGIPFTEEDPMPAVAARVWAALAKMESQA